MIFGGMSLNPVSHQVVEQCGHDTPFPDASFHFKGDVAVPNSASEMLVIALEYLNYHMRYARRPEDLP